MPNYNADNIRDPWRGLQSATNALFGVAAMAQRDRQLATEEERNRIFNEKWDSEKVLIPLKYQQAKMEVGMQLLPGLRRENYDKFHKWAMEPIDKKSGHGAIPSELLPDPQQIATMTDDQFNGLKRQMFLSAKQLSEMSVADYKANIEERLAKAKGEQTEREIEARGKVLAANDARTMAQIGAQSGLEELRAKNALAIESTRQANTMEELKKRGELAQAGLTGRGARDPRMMDIMNRVQALTDKKRDILKELLPGMPPPTEVLNQIDKEISDWAQRYRQIGGDPSDLLQGQQAQPAAGRGMPGISERVYIPGKGFISPGQANAGMTP
jgi:hypothetical protein